MSKISLLFTFLFFGTFSYGQQDAPIEDRFDNLASEWLQYSGQLKTYGGVSQYCNDAEFRANVDQILKELHRYDSTILVMVRDKSAYINWSEKEEKKMMKDIAEMETRFSTEQFIDQMKKTCLFRKDIEGNAEDLRNGVGIESYDSKILLLETELRKFLNKIDKLALRIDDHLHVLHIDY